jgi:ribonuclease J
MTAAALVNGPSGTIEYSNSLDHVELIGLGGYTEYGRNCTILKQGREFILLDLGVGFDCGHNSRSDIYPIVDTVKKLIEEGCQLLGVCISHAHLDHWGALGCVLEEYQLPVLCTRFNYQFHRRWIGALNIDLRVVEFNSPVGLSNSFQIEYHRVQHSTPESSAISVVVGGKHVLYLSDWKVDLLPTLEEPCTFADLSKLDIDYLIVDATSIDKPICHSESVAVAKLRDVMHYSHQFNDLLILTTFSSHVARLNSILQIAGELGRVVLATNTYYQAVQAGVRSGLIKSSTLHLRKMKISDMAHEVMGDRSKYIIICSGHQFEERNGISQLMFGGQYKWTGDQAIIKSARLISGDLYSIQRTRFLDFVKANSISVYDGIHQSGHAGYREQRDVLKRLRPKNVIPTHASLNNFAVYANMAQKLGYTLSKDCHLLPNLRRLIL